MTLPTGNQVNPLLMPDTAEVATANKARFARSWLKPRALAVLAITAGSLGLATSAFADSTGTSEAATTGAVSSQALYTPTVLDLNAPLFVYVANASRLVIEVTPSGSLVIFLRPMVIATPAPAVTAKPRIATLAVLRPKVAAVPAIMVTSTSAPKPGFNSSRHGYCSHWEWQGYWGNAGNGDPHNGGGWGHR